MWANRGAAMCVSYRVLYELYCRQPHLARAEPTPAPLAAAPERGGAGRGAGARGGGGGGGAGGRAAQGARALPAVPQAPVHRDAAPLPLRRAVLRAAPLRRGARLRLRLPRRRRPRALPAARRRPATDRRAAPPLAPRASPYIYVIASKIFTITLARCDEDRRSAVECPPPPSFPDKRLRAAIQKNILMLFKN